ncbi:MAG: hypothetical protein N2109_10825 [Fimbriimonadales bacterium]|nr:hypothetical protein [Fimbriimonadales bacterium]
MRTTDMGGDRERGAWGVLQRGERLLRLGDPEGAAVCARRVAARDPDHLGALELLSKALWQLGDLEEVVRCARRLSSLFPYEPGYFAMEAEALSELGRLEEAKAARQRANEAVLLSRQAAVGDSDWESPSARGAVFLPVSEDGPDRTEAIAVARPILRRPWTA